MFSILIIKFKQRDFLQKKEKASSGEGKTNREKGLKFAFQFRLMLSHFKKPRGRKVTGAMAAYA
jgi:hypothetical protein